MFLRRSKILRRWHVSPAKAALWMDALPPPPPPPSRTCDGGGGGGGLAWCGDPAAVAGACVRPRTGRKEQPPAGCSESSRGAHRRRRAPRPGRGNGAGDQDVASTSCAAGRTWFRGRGMCDPAIRSRFPAEQRNAAAAQIELQLLDWRDSGPNTVASFQALQPPGSTTTTSSTLSAWAKEQRVPPTLHAGTPRTW